MAERYISELTLRNGGGLTIRGTGTVDDGNIIIGAYPWAFALDPQDALALSVQLDRAYRALHQQAPR